MMTTLQNPDTFGSRIQMKRVDRWVKDGNIASRSLSLSSYKAVLLLDDLRLMLNKAVKGLGLRPVRVLSKDCCVMNVKEFCGGLLDRCSKHGWITTLRVNHISMRNRLTVASSLFSLRKLLTSKKPDVAHYVTKMSVPSPPLDARFAAFVYKEIPKILKHGWDTGYASYSKNFTPPTKSNLSKRSTGTYREFATDDPDSRAFYQRWANGTVCEPIPGKVRPVAVNCDGKWRVITLSDWRMSHLLPLHRCLYGALSKKKWLLRGEADPSRFEDFGRKEGEVFVSGDYESATDNININLTKLVLDRVLSLATHVPTRVREEAEASLMPDFVDSNGVKTGALRRGQLMGSPLSFPLLCLINYLSFRYAVRREVPVRINGDDIVFRCLPSEADDWFDVVSRSGLVVSKGKTMVHRSIFSINSSYFRPLDRGAVRNPLLRLSNIFKKCPDIGSLVGRVAQIKRDLSAGAIRYLALRVLLLRNLKAIYSSQGSFMRRFSCPIPRLVLKQVGLLDRESFYMGLPFETPPVMVYKEMVQEIVPRSWRKESSLFRVCDVVDEDTVVETMVDRSWTQPVSHQTRDEYWGRVRDDSFKYNPWTKRVLHLFRRCGGLYRPALPAYHSPPQGVWCLEKEKKEPEGGLRSLPITFRSSRR